ncbi:MAG TPA: cation-translocating P-type ATPase, partial [Candidatus Woesebacteria bacterium]|nr:cation-translocating P-type ATPase [Candidatus Woesebacteria bacterium]
YAGTINSQGYLEIEVTKESKNSTLQRIVDLTSNATANKANYQKFIEKFSNYYTPAVLLLAILLVLIPVLLGQDFREWFERGITLLLIACPCALVISTPISIFSAVGNASTKGILVKGGRFLEEIGGIKAMAFDKTRTLTYGKPKIEEIITYQEATEEEILACAAGLEKHSEHPMAHAVIEYAREKSIKEHLVKDFRSIAGKGIAADCLICKVGQHILGNLDLIIDHDNKVSNEIKNKIAEIQDRGNTPLILADHEGVKGIIVVSDEIRPESEQLINYLNQLKIKPVVLTGDNQKTANTVAKKLDIDEVYGNLLPEGKVEKFQLLKQLYGKVAMVGDGVNDAPVLAASNVGIAMGAVGSDIAIESADIALMNDKIELLPFLIKLGRHTKQTIQLNIAFAMITKLIALILAGLGIIGLGIAIFADVGVTVLVILLSLNILNYNDRS